MRAMFRVGAVLVLTAACFLLLVPARAHRLDSCFSPRSGPPGTIITICKAFRVEWNPFVHSPGAPYYPNRPSPILLDRPNPRLNVRVVIPETQPGVYAIDAYDGSEAGGHYFWTTFRVLPSSLARTGGDLSLAALACLGVLVLGTAMLILGREHRPA